VPACMLADRLREDQSHESSRRLLALCLAILDAYSDLHRRGVIHTDVHPNNVLAGGEKTITIRILDFGLSRVPSVERLATPFRGAVPFFIDPACAAAMRDESTMPQADEASEQYALAALLRLLLAGKPYLDFYLQRSEMLRQIVEDRPLPFVRQGVRPWLEVERVLNRALDKDPARRFPSISAFAEQLAEAGREQAPGILIRTDDPAKSLLRGVLERISPGGAAFAQSRNGIPLCSVNTGVAGVAYALYRMAQSREDAELLSVADLWADTAARHVNEEMALYNDELDLTPTSVGRISLFHTVAGVACVRALVSYALGNEASASASVSRFISASRGPYHCLDLTLGRSGTLLGCAALLDRAPLEAAAARSALSELGEQIADEIKASIADLPVAPGEALNFGIAHGWAGVLFCLLRWSESSGNAPDPRVKSWLEELASHAEPIGKGLRWPWTGAGQSGREVFMPGWCNGSAGFVHLWTLPDRAFGTDDFLSFAERAAWNAWEETINIGDLCCGAAGRAYSLLNLYRHTGDAAWLERARQLGDQAAAAVARWSLQPCSLYKGEIGVALLASDLDCPELSGMRLFDREV
jgi:hypothetical protein